jgi:transposase-like protein
MFDKKRLQAQMVLAGMNVKEVSAALGINETTFYRKLNNDGDFSRKEISQLVEILKIEDPMIIFFADEIA